jgi:hypothetical protein
MLPEKKTIHELLDFTPHAFRAWVEKYADAIDGSQDWQHLVYGVSSGAAVDSSLSDEEYDDLVTAVVLIYDRLATTCSVPSDCSSAEYKSMSWRRVLINRFGPQVGHQFRDPAILEEWFFRGLPMSFDEAVSLAIKPEQLSTVDFLRLCFVKDCVRLIKSLKSQHLFRRSNELTKWYTLLREDNGSVAKERNGKGDIVNP